MAQHSLTLTSSFGHESCRIDQDLSLQHANCMAFCVVQQGSTAQLVDLRQKEEVRRGSAVLWFVLVRGDAASSSYTPRRARRGVFGIDWDVATGTPPARGCQKERMCYTLELVFMHGRRRCRSGRVVIAHADLCFFPGLGGGGLQDFILWDIVLVAAQHVAVVKIFHLQILRHFAHLPTSESLCACLCRATEADMKANTRPTSPIPCGRVVADGACGTD